MRNHAFLPHMRNDEYMNLRRAMANKHFFLLQLMQVPVFQAFRNPIHVDHNACVSISLLDSCLDGSSDRCPVI